MADALITLITCNDALFMRKQLKSRTIGKKTREKGQTNELIPAGFHSQIFLNLERGTKNVRRRRNSIIFYLKQGNRSYLYLELAASILIRHNDSPFHGRLGVPAANANQLKCKWTEPREAMTCSPWTFPPANLH